MSPAPSSHPNQAANLALCDGQHTAEAELMDALAAVGDGDAGLLSTLEAPGTVGLVVYGPLPATGSLMMWERRRGINQRKN